jgi:hypothetical protein
MRHILVGTIGYHNLRDFSLGPKLLPDLRAMTWPPGVVVEEMNWGPIAIVQNFQALTTPYDRVVLLVANRRQRPTGTITVYRWRGGLPPPDEIQDRVAEAVTGVISSDNLLIVGEYFKIWPEEVLIVDVEPGPEEAGDTLTPLIRERIPTILAMVQRVTVEDLATLPPLDDLKGEFIRLTSGPSEN